MKEWTGQIAMKDRIWKRIDEGSFEKVNCWIWEAKSDPRMLGVKAA